MVNQLVRFCSAFYLATIGSNAILHGYDAWDASQESQKTHYGSNLSQQWENYSIWHRERLTDLKLLLPFSYIGSPAPPLRVVFKSFDNQVKIKFDVNE